MTSPIIVHRFKCKIISKHFLYSSGKNCKAVAMYRLFVFSIIIECFIDEMLCRTCYLAIRGKLYILASFFKG